MNGALGIAGYVLREARSRKFILAFVLGITLLLVTLALSLKLEVLDGALAATRLFGTLAHHDIVAVDVALRPIYRAAAYLVFYGGLLFGILAYSDFAPSLLSPGRIEHLLALPLRRWELLLGTFLGVVALALAGALYGSVGLVLILGVKTGYWTAGPLYAALLASVGFAAVYAVMLATATLVRSAALCAAAGGLCLVGGILASYRASIAPLLEEGPSRGAFRAVTLLLPRIASLADAGASLAASAPLGVRSLAGLLAGVAVFGLGTLAVGLWRFEGKDY
ncbi:ABC transporter permease subunit [Aggregicoccus sp. 17bor-14]|uniref:ABC transporter permease subunit n=1 Tax=Myxococcaceae TaxID=31 RepID=UPI00129CA084|nr:MULTISPECIES: ABC transporter permease subunit [Myxococcaceae]MBF5044094.1 ABC transporter permease subunit [Simulacricoccus sp. 17bor-14]MRI89845.1 ABC transporter permease subunit [Aggregicoccus sp. 17bor-14]